MLSEEFPEVNNLRGRFWILLNLFKLVWEALSHISNPYKIKG